MLGTGRDRRRVLAARGDVPRSTVYEPARARRIPFVKVGRRTLFDPQALTEWIGEQTVAPRR